MSFTLREAASLILKLLHVLDSQWKLYCLFLFFFLWVYLRDFWPIRELASGATALLKLQQTIYTCSMVAIQLNWFHKKKKTFLVLATKTERITLWSPSLFFSFFFFLYCFPISCSTSSGRAACSTHLFFSSIYLFTLVFSQSVHQLEAFCSRADIKCTVCGLCPFMTHQADKTGANRARAAADSRLRSFTAFFFPVFFPPSLMRIA